MTTNDLIGYAARIEDAVGKIDLYAWIARLIDDRFQREAISELLEIVRRMRTDLWCIEEDLSAYADKKKDVDGSM